MQDALHNYLAHYRATTRVRKRRSFAMKFMSLFMTALCFGIAVVCVMQNHDFWAGLNVFAAVFNAGNYFDYLANDH
jgi:hypothetical protein